jgi:enamine deaminase RidA (YjgF/YER057c/UK114 family)
MKTYINPETLPHNPAFTQAIVVRPAGTTVYVGGQNGVRADGSLAGDTLVEQARQALSNVRAALEAADAKLTDVVRWTVAVVDGQPLGDGFAAFREAWGDAGDPPTISVYVVAGLASPAFLIEIDAIAAL